MQLKHHIEWNKWLEEYLLKLGIQMFDWKTYLEEERKANEKRLSKMTQEEQDEELLKDFQELEAMMEDEGFESDDWDEVK